mmetsp:Transcript_29737/g.85239  ORF Transcript_29737/g.85239 Transcript_29737/m.85239 type:complete len:118 (-) Transcript_29737:5-358(-)
MVGSFFLVAAFAADTSLNKTNPMCCSVNKSTCSRLPNCSKYARTALGFLPFMPPIQTRRPSVDRPPLELLCATMSTSLEPDRERLACPHAPTGAAAACALGGARAIGRHKGGPKRRS